MNLSNPVLRFLIYVVAVAVTVRLVWALIEPVVVPAGVLIAVTTVLWSIWRLLTRDRLL